MNISFIDSGYKDSFWPLTANRSIADLRLGILTIREKWEQIFLKAGYSSDKSISGIPDNIVPTQQYVELHGHFNDDSIPVVWTPDDLRILQYPWQLVQYNDWALRKDFQLLTYGRTSQSISATNQIINPQQIFIEEGAVVEHCIINASTGPVYIGKNASIMEGCLIRGPFALCEGATLKMGTKIYGATTIGPYCVAGGEIKNTIMQAYSNKAHDGYLGDSYIGEWCNFGAGTSNSNLKNTAGEVRVWNKAANDFVPAGNKAGLIMGDYSRAAINTSFNTGTVVGICCNIFGNAFPPKLVPDFSWGAERYQLDKAIQDIQNWKQLKGQTLSTAETDILKHLYNQST